MMYDSLLARSFSKHQQRKLGYGAMIASFFIALSFFTVFKPYLDPLQVLNVQLSIVADRKLQIVNDPPASFPQVKKETEIVTENSTLLNGTISSQEIMQNSVTEDLKSAHDSPEVVEETEIVTENPTLLNDTISSQEIMQNSVTEDLKSAHDSPEVVEETEIVTENPTLLNDTISSQETVQNPVSEDLKNANDIPVVVEVSETMMNQIQTVNHTSNTQESKTETEIVTENSTLLNDTMSSQEILQSSVTENLKNASDTPVVVEVSETMMNQIQTINHASNTQENKTGQTEARTNNEAPPTCNIMERSDFCEIKGDIRIDGNSGTVYIVSSEMDVLAATNTSWSIRPYGRKGDIAAMNNVREWSVKLVADHGDIPTCTRSHNVSSILFSLGGYSGNHFHAFTDVLVPLFATARPFNRDVQFLITNMAPWVVPKFGKLLKALSRYDLIEIDNKEDIHCFPSITVGLKGRSKKELSIDPANSAYSIKDFRQFLRATYSLKKNSVVRIKEGEKKRPRLLIISRKRSRAFTNVGEICKLAKKLGFRAVVAEPDADVSRFAQLINSCDVVLGVHGAGLTNIVFLPENAILIQVVPFGGADWVSKVYFEEPSKDMNIRYLDYKIEVEESTLIQQYPRDHVVFTDPTVIGKQGWEAFKSTYLDKQNVKLDINRFRPTLVKALQILHQ